MRLVYADAGGGYYDHPALGPAGRSGDSFVELVREDFIELPPGSTLVLIPGGIPVGVGSGGRFVPAEGMRRGKGPAFAVGALLPQGYTRTYWPAYRRPGAGRPLPLLGYTAVAWRRGRIYAAALKTDRPDRWNPARYNTPELTGLVRGLAGELPGNRLVGHLSRCALEYGCFTAQNIFYGRWEGGIPVSRACNAGCLGCISLQPAGCCPSPQSRIDFKPTVKEVVELGLRHLEGAGGPIVSFGQGCEGEPTTEEELIRESLLVLRRKTSRGTININTNAGRTGSLESLCRSGLDSVRVSLISARQSTYDYYHRPAGFGLADVRASIKAAVRLGVFTSLNLLVSPGLTDREEEVEALVRLVEETGVGMVQLRNLNIDPDLLFSGLAPAAGGTMGIPGLIAALGAVPGLRVGSFSRPAR